MFVGAFCWWMVFDWPETARFLTPDERIRVRRRIALDKQGKTAEDFDKRHTEKEKDANREIQRAFRKEQR